MKSNLLLNRALWSLTWNKINLNTHLINSYVYIYDDLHALIHSFIHSFIHSLDCILMHTHSIFFWLRINFEFKTQTTTKTKRIVNVWVSAMPKWKRLRSNSRRATTRKKSASNRSRSSNTNRSTKLKDDMSTTAWTGLIWTCSSRKRVVLARLRSRWF